MADNYSFISELNTESWSEKDIFWKVNLLVIDNLETETEKCFIIAWIKFAIKVSGLSNRF